MRYLGPLLVFWAGCTTFNNADVVVVEGEGGAAGSDAGMGGAAGSDAGTGGIAGSDAGVGGIAGNDAGTGGTGGSESDAVGLPSPQLTKEGLVTFGQLFGKGEVPSGKTVTTQYATQVDKKATWDDGSLKFVVVTVDGKKGPLNFSVVNTPSAPPPAVKYEDPGTTLDLTSGQKYDSTKAPEKVTWLEGPLVVEKILEDHNDTDLVVQFHVRHYKDGKTRTEIVVENSKAYVVPHTLKYNAHIASGSASFDTAELTHYKAQRWHHVLWHNDAANDGYVVQDTAYMTKVGVIDKYQANLQPSKVSLLKLRQECLPLDSCEYTPSMSANAVNRMSGPLPLWTTKYVTYPEDERTFKYMLAGDDGMGAYSIHFRDDDAKGILKNGALEYYPVSIIQHPGVSTDFWAYASEKDKFPCGSDLCPGQYYRVGSPNLLWHPGYQPSTAFIPYLVTGNYYWMEELAFVVSHNLIYSHPGYRMLENGYVDGMSLSVSGKGWVLREIAHGAFLLPFEYPTTKEIQIILDFNIEGLLQSYIDGVCVKIPGRPESTDCVNTIGQVFGANYLVGTTNGIGYTGVNSLEHSYFTWAIRHIEKLGYPKIQPFTQFVSRWELGAFGPNEETGFCWVSASTKSLTAKAENPNKPGQPGSWLSSMSEVFAMSFPKAVGLACPSKEMSSAALDLTPMQPTRMYGSVGDAGDYPDYMQVGLAAAIDSGSPEAKKWGAVAWQNYKSEFFNAQREAAHNDWPVWAVVPQSLNVDK